VDRGRSRVEVAGAEMVSRRGYERIKIDGKLLAESEKILHLMDLAFEAAMEANDEVPAAIYFDSPEVEAAYRKALGVE
jgi:hypothetical protein